MIENKPIKAKVSFDLDISVEEIRDYTDCYDQEFDLSDFVENRLTDAFDYFATKNIVVTETK